jgi:glycosyltransferase involved in cell wall biosynthesis
MAPEKTLFVIIPAFNEADSIAETISQIRKISDEIARLHLVTRILVIDDGSSDQTGSVAKASGADIVIPHRRNRGLGAAVRSGLEAAYKEGADFVVKFDADMQHEASDIVAIVAPLVEDKSDLVYGDRFSKIEYQMPVIRRWGNIAFRRLMIWLTRWPITDSQPGIFGVNRDYLRVFDIPGDYNYTQQILLDAFLKDMRFQQVPVHFRRRMTGKSFISLIYPFKVIPQIILVMAVSYPLKVFASLGAAFFMFAVAVFFIQVSAWLLGYTSRPVENVNLVLGSALFGIQVMMFGILARLITLTRGPRHHRNEG